MEIETRHLKATSKRKQAKEPGTATLGREGKSKLSKEERREDALALRADERRDKLRKAVGSCK